MDTENDFNQLDGDPVFGDFSQLKHWWDKTNVILGVTGSA